MDTKKNNEKGIILKSNNKLNGRRETQKVEAKRNISQRDNRLEVQAGHTGRILESRKKNKSPLPMGVIFTLATITVLFIFFIMNHAQLESYNSDIASLRNELTELQKDADKLEQRLENKNDLVDFEEYATDELGMVKSSSLPRVNITTLPDDTGDVYKYDDEQNGVGVLLSGFAEVLRDFFS